eukprot:1444564-Prymnesium_polylepis.1
MRIRDVQVEVGEVEADEAERLLVALEADGGNAGGCLGGLLRGEPLVELCLVLDGGQDEGRHLLGCEELRSLGEDLLLDRLGDARRDRLFRLREAEGVGVADADAADGAVGL